MNAQEARDISDKNQKMNGIWNNFIHKMRVKKIMRNIKSKASSGEYSLEEDLGDISTQENFEIVKELKRKGYKVEQQRWTVGYIYGEREEITLKIDWR